METRVALIGIIVEQESSAAALNALLHEYGGYIIGRMGLPLSLIHIYPSSLADRQRISPRRR